MLLQRPKYVFALRLLHPTIILRGMQAREQEGLHGPANSPQVRQDAAGGFDRLERQPGCSPAPGVTPQLPSQQEVWSLDSPVALGEQTPAPLSTMSLISARAHCISLRGHQPESLLTGKDHMLTSLVPLHLSDSPSKHRHNHVT